MIEVDQPVGPGSLLVRGLAACPSSVTETPLTDLPDVGAAPVEHAAAAWERQFDEVRLRGSRPCVLDGVLA